jgi:hypothetical protein
MFTMPYVLETAAADPLTAHGSGQASPTTGVVREGKRLRPAERFEPPASTVYKSILPLVVCRLLVVLR